MTETGASQWRRRGVVDWYELPVGRGPGRLDPETLRWWPDDFRFDPFDPGDPPREFPPPAPVENHALGWPAFSIGSVLRVLENHPIATLPNGASRFARGGWPARTAALNHRTGEASWWDPAERRWLSLGTVTDDPAAQFFGCDDGIGLLAHGGLAWLMADHTNRPVVTPGSGLGRPLAPPLRLGSDIVWPAVAAGALKFWQLSLAGRTDELADPQRYVSAKPIEVAITGRTPGQPVPEEFGHAASATTSLAWFPASDGALAIRRSPAGITAHWQPHPDHFRALPGLALHIRSDTGELEAQLESSEYVAVMALGRTDSLCPERRGLSATLGGQQWQGRHAVSSDNARMAAQPIVGDAGRWLLPLAELAGGALMLEFPDITQRDSTLRGTVKRRQRAELLTVAGGMPHPLHRGFQVRSAQDIAVIAHEDGLLVVNREDSSECVALGSL